MPSFLPLTEPQLDALSDDALIAYIRRARDADEGAQGRLALEVLVFGHWDNVRRRVALKVPAQFAEDVAGEVLLSAIRSAFDGRSVGEFRSWLSAITKRRIVDFYRHNQQATVSLDDDDGLPIHGEAMSEEGVVEVQDAIDRVLGTLSEDHRRVVALLIFEDQPASVAMAEIDGLSESNAYQVVRRFRTALRQELDANPDNGSGPDG